MKMADLGCYISVILVIILVVAISVYADPQILGNQPLEENEQPSEISTKLSCPEGWELIFNSCLKFDPSYKVNHNDAQNICREDDGFLATITSLSVETFFSRTFYGVADTNTSSIQFWMNYILIHGGQNASWDVAQEAVNGAQEMIQDQRDSFPRTVPEKLNGESMVCLLREIVYNGHEVAHALGHWKATGCKEKAAFLCERMASAPCIDWKGNSIEEGDTFTPAKSGDPCIKCTCFQGISSRCSTALCSKPNCEPYLPDDNTCCSFHCLGGNGERYPSDDVNHGNGVMITDNMRWVLTMITSFLLLGMMLFMVYRMRQKRIAYLRYRVRQLQEAQSMDFEPGSGPPPVPVMDDIDGAFFREPPPPYTCFGYLKEEDVPRESPPPYQRDSLLSTQSQSNSQLSRNYDQHSQRSDEVSLLRNSVSGSLPASPLSETASPAVFEIPPQSPGIESEPATAAEEGRGASLAASALPSSPRRNTTV